MNEQQDFIKRIQELTEIAADQENVIFEEQLFSIFPEAKADEAKLSVLKEYLSEKKIGLNDKIPFEELITEDEKNYLEYYLEDLKEQEPLTKGEREAYLLSAMAGDENAQMIILNDSLRMVVDIAKLYAGQGVWLEDLIGEGNLVLVTAVTLLGSAENAKEAEAVLSSQIMDAMQDLISENMDEEEAEDKLVKKVNKVAKAAKELSEELKRKVTIEELMNEYHMSRDYIMNALKLTGNKIEDIELPKDLE